MSYNEWTKATLDEVCDLIGDGLHGTPNYDENGQYYFINGNNLEEKLVFNDKTKKVDEIEYHKYKKDLSNRTIFLSINGTLGKTAYYNNEKIILGKSACYLNIKNSFSKEFIYYILKTPKFRSYLTNHSTGTTIKNFGLKAARKYEFMLPPVDEQKAIANILSSLDDKIEINNKINKNLEDLAQTLYKQWFVDFEFPNEDGEPYKSSGGEMVESELGLIPKGWEVETLGKSRITKIITSGINEFKEEKIYIATADVDDSSVKSYDTMITYNDRPSRANMQPTINSVWFAKMKDSRKLIRVSKNDIYKLSRLIFSTGFAGIESVEGLNYIWSFILSSEFNALKDNLCFGTTMQAINNTNIKKIPLVIPEKNVLSIFDKLINDIYNKIELNSKENELLSKTRDTLLPKLMNGEIEVPIED